MRGFFWVLAILNMGVGYRWGGTGTQCTSHTFERPTSGHRAATRLRCRAMSSSGVRDSGLSMVDSMSRSCMHAGERATCRCYASDSSPRLISGSALHDAATIVFGAAISTGRSASAKY
jgi:hypothetical protein